MQTSLDFHNTIGLEGEELSSAITTARNQGERILEFLRQHEGEKFTAYQVCDALGGSILKVSVGRSLTDLVEKKCNVYKGGLVPERYGKKNHQYYYLETTKK